MKTKIYNTITLFAILFVSQIFAQDITTVRANNADISDNLDLRAVASIFGESRDLEDFERRLNDPKIQISNLDLNRDNQVDYLRVIEATEGNTHLVILQAVIGQDLFQDIATIEVEKDRKNNVQVQVVGDTYIYGNNYIYEPVYVSRPIIYDVFWASSYRPYYSPWYWGYYPTYYSYWSPYPVYRYRNNIYVNINTRNTYNYVDTRRSTRAVALHNTRRSNSYERQNPQNSFARRNENITNRYALEQNRRNTNTTNNTATRATRNSFENTNRNSFSTTNTVRDNNINTVNRNNSNAVRNNNTINSKSTNNQTIRSASNNVTPVRNNNTNIRTTPQTNTNIRSTQPNTIQSSGIQRSSSAAQPSRNTVPAVRNNNSQIRSTPAPAIRSASPSAAPQRQNATSGGRTSGNSRG